MVWQAARQLTSTDSRRRRKHAANPVLSMVSFQRNKAVTYLAASPRPSQDVYCSGRTMLWIRASVMRAIAATLRTSCPGNCEPDTRAGNKRVLDFLADWALPANTSRRASCHRGLHMHNYENLAQACNILHVLLRSVQDSL